MGILNYAGQQFEIEDRLLAHLKIVIVQKLRRREAFLLSWPNATSEGGGRNSLWLSETMPLHFRFHGSRPPKLNRQWIEAMIAATHTMAGLILGDLIEAEGPATGAVPVVP